MKAKETVSIREVFCVGAHQTEAAIRAHALAILDQKGYLYPKLTSIRQTGGRSLQDRTYDFEVEFEHGVKPEAVLDHDGALAAERWVAFPVVAMENVVGVIADLAKRAHETAVRDHEAGLSASANLSAEISDAAEVAIKILLGIKPITPKVAE